MGESIVRGIVRAQRRQRQRERAGQGGSGAGCQAPLQKAERVSAPGAPSHQFIPFTLLGWVADETETSADACRPDWRETAFGDKTESSVRPPPLPQPPGRTQSAGAVIARRWRRWPVGQGPGNHSQKAPPPSHRGSALTRYHPVCIRQTKSETLHRREVEASELLAA